MPRYPESRLSKAEIRELGLVIPSGFLAQDLHSWLKASERATQATAGRQHH